MYYEDYCIPNREPRKQAGEIIETRTQYLGRYCTSDTYNNGRSETKAVKLCDKSDINHAKTDEQPLMDRWTTDLRTAQPTAVRDHHAKNGLGRKTLSW